MKSHALSVEIDKDQSYKYNENQTNNNIVAQGLRIISVTTTGN
ncbi:4108_t:CDS:2 [Dentiscutata erythropus]|uniref:4108_t:CDS:1 n=1 Tax=Dentiscutata erythropus TaxID=1348616 RepID=A0A9N9H0T1_9GLOM|nr:4108_t:CDS:2 [Dentiscutata erythropus]